MPERSEASGGGVVILPHQIATVADAPSQ